MIRALPRLLVCFIIPFLLYVIYLLVRQENPLVVERWTRQVVVPLSLAGLGCVIAGLLAVGITAPRFEGGYVPAHIEKGRIVPGRMP